MRSQKAFSLFVVLFFGVVVWMRVAPSVLAAAPDHDDFDFPRFLSPLTYFDIADTSEATAAADDPTDGPTEHSVWYSFTPDDPMPIEANTFGSSYDTSVAVYTGDRGALNLVAINNDHEGPQSRVHFITSPDTQYYFMISSCCESPGAPGGELNFLVKELTAPPNDNFADAAVIPEVPYPDTPLAGRSDAFASTQEPGEPTPSCSDSGTLNNSVWYAYTPAVDGSISVALNHNPERQVLAAYTGSELNALEEVGCRFYWGSGGGFLTIEVVAGTTYYFQAGNPFELGEYFWLSVEEPPPAVVEFFYSPFDPSTYDDIYFYAWEFDPAGVGIETWEWDFGDGATATGQFVLHRYAADGDYTVTLTGTTFDGRQATSSQTVSVRTNDVSITKFTTPKSGRSGQTAKIVVGVANRLTPQRVRVYLLASGPGGFQEVGQLVLFVPVQKSKTTDFLFSYTFTPQDAAIGKVNFKAVAYPESIRDALPGDNEAISLPVKVSAGAAAGKGNEVNEAVEEEMQEGFALRGEPNQDPEMQELFLLPSYRVFLPSIDTNLQD